MILPVVGATGLYGAAPAATDQPGVPGFADLVTALLAGSDVVSDEVTLSGDRPTTDAQDQGLSDTETAEDAGDQAGPDGSWSAIIVHPSLVADALLRHLGQVEAEGPLNETPVGESPPIERGVLTPVMTAPVPLVPAAVDPLVAGSPIESTVAQPPRPSIEPAGDHRPSVSAGPHAPLGPVLVMPEAMAAGAPPVATPIETQVVTPIETQDATPVEHAIENAIGTQITTPIATAIATPVAPPVAPPVAAERAHGNLRVDSAGSERKPLTGSPAERPADATIKTETERESQPTVRSDSIGEAPVILADRAQRDADVARIGTRSPEALSTAARRVEEAVRQLEAAPPPSTVTMVIEELDLRLTVALRPDGVHLSAPGPEAPTLIRSLQEALHSRGFDLSGRQRGRQGHQQPEAPAIPFAPRPTTRPASGLRL